MLRLFSITGCRRLDTLRQEASMVFELLGIRYGSSPRKIGPNLGPMRKPSIRRFAMSGLLLCAHIR